MPAPLIFDIDGTLLDSVDLHAQAWQEAFRHFGYDFPIDRIRGQIGKGGDQLLPVFLPPEDLCARGKQIEEFRGNLFKAKFLQHVKPFPGVRSLFEKVLSKGHRIALASSARGDELKEYERIAGIEDLVQVEISSADAEKSKPNPDILDAAFHRLGTGLERKNVIVIGDSPYDAEAAKRAGMKAVGVRCGGFAEADLLYAGCEAIYDGPEDLLRNYESSVLASNRN